MGLLDSIEARASIENPSTPLSDPADWVYEAFGVSGTRAGVNVSPRSSVGVSAVYSAVRLVSESLATLAVRVQRRNGDRREVVEGHPAAQALRGPPNPEMTGFVLREVCQGHAMLWGDAYMEVVRKARGFELWPLPPDRVERKRAKNGQPYYEVAVPESRGVRGRTIQLPAEDVIHVPGFGFTGTDGYRITEWREALGLAKAAEAHGASFFGNDSRPGGVLEHPATLSLESASRLKKSWEDAHRGPNNAHRVALLEEGMKFQQTAVNAKDSQFIETRQFQVLEVSRITRVPPHMIYDLARATFSNIEHQSIEFVRYTMAPWTAKWERELERKLLTERERADGLVIRLNLDSLLRGDIKSRYDSYAVGRQWGWLSANDVRRMEDMDPIDDGDIYLSPGNMLPADMAGELTEPAADGGSDLGGDPTAARALLAPGETRKAKQTRSLDSRRQLVDDFRALLREAGQKIVNREVNEAKKHVEKIREWLAGPFYEEHRQYIQTVILPILRAYFAAVQREVAHEIDGEIGLTPQMERDLDLYVERFADTHVRLSESQIRGILEDVLEPEAQRDALVQRFDEWKEGRADKLSGQEAARGGGAFAKLAYLAMGVATLRWVASGENCPYCRQLDGRVVGVSDPFASGGDVLEGDAEGERMEVKSKVGHPPLHRGCDCQIVAGD